MSGAEFVAVVGFAASVVQVLDTSKKVIERVKKYKKSIAFEDILPRLQLFLIDIEKLKSQTTNELVNKDEEAALIRVLDGCSRQLSGLDSVIQEISPAEGSSKLQRTWMGLRSFGKDSKIREFLANLDQYRATLNFHLTSRTNIMTHERFRKAEEPTLVQSYFKIPARQVSNFVGRSALLEELKEVILAADPSLPKHQGMRLPNKPTTLILTGLGGQGKSQLAMRLCQELAQNFRGVFWINASSKSSTSSDFEQYASLLSDRPLSFGEHEKNVEYFKSSLSAWEQPWLLIFDNYDNPRTFPDISNFFPSSRSPTMSTILITSRNSESGRLGRAFQLGGLSPDEGVKLLLARVHPARINDEESIAATRVVEKLGYLPLAIDQASNYIASRQMPLKLFEVEYENKKSTILAHTPTFLWEYQTSHFSKTSQATEVNLSAFTTWEFSMDQITNNRSFVEEMLTQVAFLDASSISETLLKCLSKYSAADRDANLEWLDIFCHDQQWDSSRFQDIIVELLSMSLIQGMQYEDSDLSFSLHPIVKDWLQLRIPDDQKQQKTHVAMSMLSSHIATLETEAMEFEARGELLKHVDACQLNVQQFLTTDESRQRFGGYIEGHQTVFATFFADNDRKQDAIKLYFQVLNLQESRLGIADLTTLSTMNNLGVLQLSLGQYEDAFKILDRVLSEKERILPLNHERILNTVNNLGNVCVALGYFDRATTLFQRLQKVYETDPKTTQRRFVALYNNLGEIDLRQGRIESAEAYFEKAMTHSHRSADGRLRDDEVACHVLENQAKVYESQGKIGQALNTQVEAANAFGKLLGFKHPRSVAAGESKARLWRLFELDEASTDEANSKRRRVSSSSSMLRDGSFGDSTSAQWSDSTAMDFSNGDDLEADPIGIGLYNMLPMTGGGSEMRDGDEILAGKKGAGSVASHRTLHFAGNTRPEMPENPSITPLHGIPEQQTGPKLQHGIQEQQSDPKSQYDIQKPQKPPQLGKNYGLHIRNKQAMAMFRRRYHMQTVHNGIAEVQQQSAINIQKSSGQSELFGLSEPSESPLTTPYDAQYMSANSASGGGYGVTQGPAGRPPVYGIDLPNFSNPQRQQQAQLFSSSATAPKKQHGPSVDSPATSQSPQEPC